MLMDQRSRHVIPPVVSRPLTTTDACPTVRTQGPASDSADWSSARDPSEATRERSAPISLRQMHEEDPPVDPDETGEAPITTTIGRRRFALHALALLLVLCALVPLIDNGTFAIPDEGLYAAQADNLARGSWSQPRPTAAIDEHGNWFVLSGSIIIGSEAIPYVRRPLYPFVASPFWSVGGVAGVLVLSVLGTWAAACASAAIGCTFDRRTAIPALWLVGLGTPLLFDAYLLVGHSLASAFAASAALGALQCQRIAPNFSARWFGWLVFAAGGAAVATLLRSEGVLYVAALAGSLGMAAVLWRRRSAARRWADAVIGAALMATGVAAYLANDVWSKAIAQGAAGDPTLSERRPDFLAAAWTELVRPWFPDNTAASAAMALVLLTSVAAPLVLRFLPRFRVLGTGLLVLGASAAAWNALSSPQLISGLLPTVPWIVVGLLSLRRRDLKGPGPAVILLSTGAFVVAVLATSYGFGGAAEWGGRFFHVGLPALAPLAVLGLIGLRECLPITARRVVIAALAVTALALSTTALRTNYQLRTESRQLVDLVAQTRSIAPESAATVWATIGSDGTPRILWQESSAGRPLLTADGLINVPLLLSQLPRDRSQVKLITNLSGAARLDPILRKAAGKGWHVTDDRMDHATGLAVFSLARS